MPKVDPGTVVPYNGAFWTVVSSISFGSVTLATTDETHGWSLVGHELEETAKLYLPGATRGWIVNVASLLASLLTNDYFTMGTIVHDGGYSYELIDYVTMSDLLYTRRRRGVRITEERWKVARDWFYQQLLNVERKEELLWMA